MDVPAHARQRGPEPAPPEPVPPGPTPPGPAPPNPVPPEPAPTPQPAPPEPAPTPEPAPPEPTSPGPTPLPDNMQAALDGFERHLAAERGLSPHTVRAYIGDVRSLLEHAAGDDITAPDRLDIAVLRRWLASQYRTGHARATLARRAAAARTFTAWACAAGWLSPDPGLLLGTAKVRRRLPQVPRQDQMAAVLSAAGSTPGGSGGGGSAGGGGSGARNSGGRSSGHGAEAELALRDAAIMELLYATGIRVSELCGL